MVVGPTIVDSIFHNKNNNNIIIIHSNTNNRCIGSFGGVLMYSFFI
jgi:hypothetical protein